MDIEKIRKQAQDENTPSQILVELATSEDRLTCKYVASNPNTPVNILEQLSLDFPDAITQNPTFNLLMLENPERKFLLLCLAKSSSTTQEKLRELANRKDVHIQEAVAKNKNISLETMAYLAQNRTNLAYQPKKVRPNDIIINPGDSVRVALAKREDIPKTIANTLAQDNSNYVRRHLAMNPNIPLEIIQSLSEDDDYYVRVGVAMNVSTSREIFYKLATDSHLKVRREVAGNPKMPIEILDKLKTDDNKYVRQQLARNPSISLEIREHLAEDPIDFVRQALKENS